MFKRRKTMRIRQKLIRYTTLLVILPLCAVLALISILVSVYLTNQTLDAFEKYTSQVATNIDQLVEIVNYATSKMMINQNLLHNLRTANSAAQGSYAHYKAVSGISEEIENIENSVMSPLGGKIIVLTQDNYRIHYTDEGYSRVDYTASDWYAEARKNARIPVYSPDIVSVFRENPAYSLILSDYKTLSSVRAIKTYSGEMLGAILVQISSSRIWDNYLDAELLADGRTLMIFSTADELLMFSSGSEISSIDMTSNAEEILALPAGASLTGNTTDGRYFMAVRLRNSPNILICAQPGSTLFEANRSIVAAMVAVLIVLTGAMLLTVYLISTHITQPITAMAVTMDSSPGMPASKMTTDSGFMEVDMLADSYNRAWERVNQLLQQVKAETELREKTYYEMLMSQISPHFISNTVNSIRILAGTADRQLTVEALEALGVILQSVYENKSDITIIARENQLLSSYVKIMRMRFGYQFQYIEDIPLELYTCEIPTFTLQPLVENAILHGVLDKEAGQIIVSAEATGTDIYISVFNNSPSDDISVARHALEHETRSQSQFTGIGLYNINTRLKILYGEQYGLTIDEVQKSGFEVVVHLPRKEGAINA